VTGLTFTPGVQQVDGVGTPAELIEVYKSSYGPTIMAYRSLEGDAERTAALDRALLAHAERTNLAGPGEPARWAFAYVLIVGTRGARSGR
jgi:hypothetical protein